MFLKCLLLPRGTSLTRKFSNKYINGRVMFLITRFELGSCYDKYAFNLQSSFYILPIHLLAKFRNWENESLASFG